MRFLLQPLLYVWAGPASLIGLLLGVAALLTGGRAQRRSGVLEFYGGAAAWLLRHAPLVGNAMAMTLGHVVLGQTAAGLDIARRHELVHVRQYERWGPLFLPLYAWLSLWMWWQGRDPYRDNPFEREAFAAEELPPGQVG
ncbi:MAG: hypothetical protein JNG90_04655 [Planctomycetaceae bacterium]|nr:hypothetical protein [Planctomycetaceae bacterium]